MLDILTQSPYYPTPTVDIVLSQQPHSQPTPAPHKHKWRQRQTATAQTQTFNFDDRQCFSYLNRPHSSIQTKHPSRAHRKAVSQVFNLKQMKQHRPDSSKTLETKRSQGEHAQLIKTISLRVCDSATIGQEEEEYRVSTSHSLRRKWKQQPKTQRQLQCYSFSRPNSRSQLEGNQQFANPKTLRPSRQQTNKALQRGCSQQRSRKTSNLKANQQSFLQFSVIKPKEMEVQPLYLTSFQNYLPPQSAQQRRVYLNMLQQIRAREQSHRRSILQNLQGRVRNDNTNYAVRAQIHTSYLSRKRCQGDDRNELRPWEVDCNQIDFI